MTTTETRWGAGVNAEAIAAWDGPLYDRFVRYRHGHPVSGPRHRLDVASAVRGRIDRLAQRRDALRQVGVFHQRSTPDLPL